MESTLKPIIQSKLAAIVQAIDIIQERCKEYDDVNVLISDFWGATIFDSCILRLQTIGENVKSINDRTNGTFLSDYPNIPWHQIIGLRNILAHQYENVDPDIIWSVIKYHLSGLRVTIVQIQEDLLSSESNHQS